uniref:Putative ovule protein n=1 Tax=Solanum chacoense TaxID=4108 RepID=A0A0V0GYB8_SOLCH
MQALALMNKKGEFQPLNKYKSKCKQHEESGINARQQDGKNYKCEKKGIKSIQQEKVKALSKVLRCLQLKIWLNLGHAHVYYISF